MRCPKPFWGSILVKLGHCITKVHFKDPYYNSNLHCLGWCTLEHLATRGILGYLKSISLLQWPNLTKYIKMPEIRPSNGSGQLISWCIISYNVLTFFICSRAFVIRFCSSWYHIKGHNYGNLQLKFKQDPLHISWSAATPSSSRW
jgi:hypothetical protein